MTDALLFSCLSNLDYARRLVADLPEALMVHLPQPGMNHPTWVLCHLCLYHPAALGLARGEAFADPAAHPDAWRYDEGSTPVADPAQYPSKSQVMEQFQEGHAQIAQALRTMDATGLSRPVPLERWQALFPTTGAALVYLLAAHESVHLGQLSAWRRVQGLPRV